jgi:hypothetical protein
VWWVVHDDNRHEDIADISMTVSGCTGGGHGPVMSPWCSLGPCDGVKSLAHWCRCTMGMSRVRTH